MTTAGFVLSSQGNSANAIEHNAMTSSTNSLHVLLMALVALTGCQTTKPWASREPASLASRYAEGNQPEVDIKDSLLDLFASKALGDIVERALSNNPDLLRSRARLEELGFSLTKTRASLLPSITAGGSRSDAMVSDPTTAYDASLDARWEIDVWGRLRSGVRAAAADQSAALADYESARQSLAAQVIQAWFQLVAADKSLALDERRVTSFDSTGKLVQRRFELGQATLGQLKLAKTDLESARADIESSTDQRDRAARQLRLLAGDYPEASLSANSWPSLQRSVPAGLPSDLLLRRPDVAAAYHSIRAADSRVRVAHADLFPSFSLTASGGRQGNVLSELANSNFNYWNLIVNLSAPLFDGGQRRSELGAAGKRAEQAFRNYQSVVLNALREVEDALGSEGYLAREETARNAALGQARGAYERTRRDYESGITDILTLLETQRGLFAIEQQIINLRASRLNNRVALALALGKGK